MTTETERFGSGVAGEAPPGLKFAARPGVGQSGKPVRIRVNMFEMQKFTTGMVYQYDVVMNPDVPPGIARHVFQSFEKQFFDTELGKVLPVYDGRKAMYTSKEIPNIGRDASTFKVSYLEEGRKDEPRAFTISIKLVSEINMYALMAFIGGETSTLQAQDAIQVLDIVLRHKPSLQLSIFGRSLYSERNLMRLGGGVNACKGFFSSVRPAAGKLLVNVDTSATAYYQSGNVLDVLVEVLGKRGRDSLQQGLSEMERMKAERFFKGTKVEVTYHSAIKRRFRVLGVSKEPVNQAKFYNEAAGREQTVAEYYQETHQLRLVFQGLCCLRVGNPERNTLIPMEVCSLLPGQRYPRKLNETQTAGMIKFTARPPQERAAAIVEGLQTLEYAQGNQYMKEFNMAVSSQMLQVQGRILSPPTLLYGGRDPQIQPRNGGWNMRGKQVIQSAFLRCWMVVCYGSQRDFSQQQIERFIFEFVKQAKATGFNIPMERPPIIYVSPQDDPSVCLQNAADRGRRLLGRVPEMIMCVLPGKGTHPYADIKRASDTVLGIPTQCVQGMHTRSPNPQYVSNVCLKMNMKLGGDNWRLPRPLPVIGEAITIVFGADVSHPPPGDTRRPSIVAVVASVDPFATKYVGCIRYQGSRVEHINDLETLSQDLLRKFYQRTNRKPQRVIFYRDGLSEGQFGGVALTEIRSIKRAFAKLENVREQEVKVPVTYIAVQKRHHIRMFPMPNEGDKNGNVLAGTVIDQEITHPYEFNFYMCSHGSLLGTSRPAHYYVLMDENGLSSDKVQQMTYELCYLFGRATRSVSIVPPVYYADILAYRARYHTTQDWEESAGGSDRVSTVSSEFSFAAVSKQLEDTMFYV